MSYLSFEVNTDSEFIDPDWELFAELHDRRYGLAISYVKSVVDGSALDRPRPGGAPADGAVDVQKEGQQKSDPAETVHLEAVQHEAGPTLLPQAQPNSVGSFDNAVMDVRVGEAGFYVQSKNFPAAFYGDTGAATHSFVTPTEAQEAVFDAVALYRAGDARSLTCVYSDSNPGDVFFGYRTDDERYELGFMRPSLPLHLRVMVDAAEATELLGDTKGVLIYQRTVDGRHLLVRAPGRRQPFMLLDGFDD